MANTPFASGGCSCGAVSLTVTGEPKMMVQCHCSHCQKATGTGHISNAMFSEDDVEISGSPTSYRLEADSGNVKSLYFCPTCGSRLFTKNSGRPGITTVHVGCLDDQSWYAPQAVVFTKNRSDWDLTSDQIPNFEEMPPPKG